MQRVPQRSVPTVRAFLTSPPVWLCAILLLAFTLRLTHLGAMSIWWDESLSWDRATQDLPAILSNTIRIQNVETHDLHPPLYFVLLHFAVLALGVSEFALRVLSTFANLLTLALLYPLTRTIAGRRRVPVGLLTVLFAALSPFYVWYSQEARPYALVLLWSLLALYALLRFLQVGRAEHGLESRSKGRPYKFLALFLLALAATLATHYLSFVLLPFYAATILIFGDRGSTGRERLRSVNTLVAFLLLAAFAVILIAVPRGAEALTGSELNGPGAVPFFIMLRDVWNSFAIGLTANLDSVALLDWALVALWVLGVASTFQPRRREWRLPLFLLAFMFVPPLALQLGSYLRPLYLNSRHLITASPAFYLGIALGVDALARRAAGVRMRGVSTRARYAGVAALGAAVFIAGALYSLNNLYFDASYAKDDHKAWAQFLRDRLHPDDYLILVAPQAEKIVEYYAPPGLQWISLPNLVAKQAKQQRLDFEAVLNAYRQHDRVWFLEIHQPVADPKHHIAELLHRYGDPVDITFFPGISTQIILQEFVHGSPALKGEAKPQHPTELSFNDNLELLGYDDAAPVTAGSRGALKLYWRLKEKTPDDLGVSLRVVDDAGNRWGQWDAPPVGNLLPTSKWDADAVMVDMHDLPLDAGTPPGTYHVELGVFRESDHAPLDASAADGTVRLGDVTVTRPQPPLDPSALSMDSHADVKFGDALRFVGYDSETPTVDPGGTIPMTLYFQVVKPSNSEYKGRVTLSPPVWQFWNSTRASAPFSLSLAGRLPGDIVQTRIGVRAPGNASEGGYDLALTMEGQPASGLFNLGRDTMNIGSAEIAAIARDTAIPPMAHPFQARLGDAVELIGYDVRAPSPVHAGDTVNLTLYWRALQTMDTSYTVFTHLLGADNKVAAQHDGLPVAGTRPTTGWAPGEIFADSHTLIIGTDATPGKYPVEVGMYEAATNTRLPAFDAKGDPNGDRILLEELAIQ